MKLVYLLFLTSFITKAQDTLIFKNATKIVSLVLLVDEDSIRYKRIENIGGVDLYAKNSEVSFIKYKTGAVKNMDSLYQLRLRRKELAAKYVVIPEDQTITPESIRERGKQHAAVNYRCKGCTVALAAETFLFIPFGWLTAYTVMYVPPKEKNLAYPSEELWQDENYKKGYKAQAAKMKRESMRNGAWIGTFSVILVYIGVLTFQNNSNP